MGYGMLVFSSPKPFFQGLLKDLREVYFIPLSLFIKPIGNRKSFFN